VNYRQKFERPVGFAIKLPYDEDISRDRLPEDVDYFFELYRDAFQHHVTPHLLADGRSLNTTQDPSRKRLFQADKITAYFVWSVYSPLGISKTDSTSQIDNAKHAISKFHTEFFVPITASPVSDDFAETNAPGSNRLNFLVGDIGQGKSLLATKIGHELRGPVGEVADRLDAKGFRVIPVYADFESLLPQREGEFDDIDENFYAGLHNLILTELKRTDALRDVVSSHVNRLGPATRNIRDLTIDLLKQPTPTRLVIILDNVDRYHFFYSNYVFFDAYRRLQTEKIARNIDLLLERFSNSQYLGDCGLCILFVCRPGILKTLSVRNNILNNRKRLFQDFGVYRLSSTATRSVIDSRFGLMGQAIALIREETKRGEYQVILDQIREAFDTSLKDGAGRNSLNLIADLAHHGPRSFVDFVGSMHFDYREQYDLAKRFFKDQPHNLLRVYITNFKKRYCEAKGHFPNMFLVDAVISPSAKFAELAHQPHRHTYWLRYLLLKYIQKRTSSTRKFVTFQELKEVFCGSESYEEHLLRFTLGSLSAVNTANCIVVDEPIDDATVRVCLTSRGRALIDSGLDPRGSEFCFNFDYLQFVIDDYQLSFPSGYLDKIYVEEDLSYMFYPTASHAAGLSKYLAAKTAAVVYFLRVLEASAAAEKKFRIVGNDAVKSLFPDFDGIFGSLNSTFERILPIVQNGHQIADTARQLIGKLRGDTSFDDFFQCYSLKALKVEPS
jgi:hypothetical protein